MKVAILAYYFKPDEAIGSVRPENWANWLSKEHDVVVITREAANNKDELDAYKILRPKSLSIRVLEFFNKQRKKRRLAQAARETVPAPAQGPAEPSASSGIFSYRMPCLHDLWLLAGYRALRRAKPDLIIATHSPYVNILIAYCYSRLHNDVKLWLDFRDLWSANHLATGVPFFSWIEKRLERFALGRAEIISSVSDGLKEQLFLQSGSKKVRLIYNCPAKLAGSISCASPKWKQGISFCYTGTIYSGWRDPSPLFSLLGNLKEAGKIDAENVKFCVASKMPGNLIELAKSFCVTDFVDFKGSLSREESINLQASSDILVLLEASAPEAIGVLTGKVFEYLVTDKPILLIGPGPDSELYKLISQHGRLISLDEVRLILEGERELGTYKSVDYSELARSQVLEAVNSLATDSHETHR